MKRTTRNTLKFTAEHAAHALHILVADGKIAAKDVAQALNRREGLIRELRERLVALEGGVVATARKAGRRIAGKAKPKPKRKMTAARRADLRLHGKYLGHVRMLPKAAKAKIKAIREKKGVQAAIREAQKVAERRFIARKTGSEETSKNQKRGRNPQRNPLRASRRPDAHGGSGVGRQEGGSGAGREHG